MREEWTSSISKPFKKVNREFIFSFREETVSHKNTESFMADILANAMCKIFSSLKIKQILWNLIRLKRDLCLVFLFPHPLVLVITGYQHHILLKKSVLPKNLLSVIPNLDMDSARSCITGRQFNTEPWPCNKLPRKPSSSSIVIIRGYYTEI